MLGDAAPDAVALAVAAYLFAPALVLAAGWFMPPLDPLLREPDGRGLRPSVLARCWGR